MAKHWIAGAIKRPGQLHRDLGIPQDQKIPAKALQRALSGELGPKVAARARLAKTLKGMH